VKKALLGASETKHKYYAISGTNIDNLPSYENLFYWIGQGSGDAQRIGDKIYVKSVTMKFNITSIEANASDSDLKLKMWIVKARDTTRSGTLGPSFGTWTATGLLKQGNNYTNAIMDTERQTFVKTKKCTLPYNQIANVARWKQFTWTWKVNKNIQYDGDNSGYIKTGQYYLMYAVQNIGNSAGLPIVNMNVDVDISYKDL